MYVEMQKPDLIKWLGYTPFENYEFYDIYINEDKSYNYCFNLKFEVDKTFSKYLTSNLNSNLPRTYLSGYDYDNDLIYCGSDAYIKLYIQLSINHYVNWFINKSAGFTQIKNAIEYEVYENKLCRESIMPAYLVRINSRNINDMFYNFIKNRGFYFEINWKESGFYYLRRLDFGFIEALNYYLYLKSRNMDFEYYFNL